ncbi:hypothetical protein [Gordonia sp. (in: high G+C Gram-positive bacteria)]|uniref:hypothetical protein n=1 Tax=Gordonia sp. (in: high G+C Gram-positive bacteria) TaxID=84139 RepID=UPI003527FE2A
MTHRPPPPAPDPRPSSRALPRRTVLRGGAALTLAAAAGPALAACAPGPSERERQARELVPLARSAELQQRQAKQLAPRETDYTDALNRVAAERGDHAQALTDEINRLHAPAATEITAPAGDGTTNLTLDGLRDGLTSAARDSAGAAVAAAGFRAGLLGSISASCTTLREVQLA